MKKLQSCVKIAAISVATVFSLTQPAKAVLFNTFTYDNDNGTTTGGSVTGSIGFNSLNPGDSASGVAADSLTIDSVPSFLEANFDDAFGFQLGENILTSPDLVNLSGNSWNINSGVVEVPTGNIFNANTNNSASTDNYERVFFNNSSSFNNLVNANDDSFTGTESINYARDFTSPNSLVFTPETSSASVPFEFSPTLGLLLMGGMFGISRYAKSRKVSKLNGN